MKADFIWGDRFAQDVEFGFIGRDVTAPKQLHPQVVLNNRSSSVLRALRAELGRCDSFMFSVAFVSPRAIALLKQELVEFGGAGTIVTSDYLAFNSPAAFAELLNLASLGIDVRLHSSKAFHPKGYIFENAHGVTAIIGSSNLTESALVTNHEWNLKVSAAADSDLSAQVSALVAQQAADSVPLTEEWIRNYTESYVSPHRGHVAVPVGLSPDSSEPEILPNRMQRDALGAIAHVRSEGHERAVVISATGTGKTMLSALDVRSAEPRRMLFVAHREQILDRTIREYRRVLGGGAGDYGKLTGSVKQPDARYLFATVQTLSQPGVLAEFDPAEFDYVVVDEAHRAGAATHRRVIEYFSPSFLLGMTATPERPDGFNVFELFNYVVPYEIRLNHALEEAMLSPFHYYGIADVTFHDGATTSDVTDVGRLTGNQRVSHIVKALDTYGQAGVPPRGLIFCSRKDEARDLAAALNTRSMRGRTLRTVSLTGDDSVAHRELMVERLEAGELDYILTVDVFNEGVDIPSVNQVVMLRQTQSAIVFVQQLGRGLRKADGKDYLVVIDFIGNYANNYLIPVALFGDESLNKESLRKNLIASEEIGVLAGLSSVRFDRVSQERVLRSIVDTSLDSMPKIRTALQAMQNRVCGAPKLWDFLRFESVDPVVLATKRENFPALVESVLRIESGLTPSESKAIGLLSHEVLPATRGHEFVLLRALLDRGALGSESIMALFESASLAASARHVDSAIDTFTLEHHAQADRKRYGSGIAVRTEAGVELKPEFIGSYANSQEFAAAVDDIIRTGMAMVVDRYLDGVPFAPGRQYSRKEVTRLLCMPRKWTSTLYGYKVDRSTSSCPIFVTLHKSGEVVASQAYEDELVDASTMRWFTKSRRTLQSPEVRAIVDGNVQPYVFVKKDDAEGVGFYYLGQATAHDAEQTTMPGADGRPLDVVRMLLQFDEPIEAALFDYLHPLVTA